MKKPNSISVILSTYNSPDWLKKVLYGYHIQDYRPFEIVIADDGSTEETKKLIDDFSRTTDLEIKHIWQPDDGFQKSRILNKAIMASEGEYLLFSDGDCIPRKDFVSVHKRFSEKGYFLSGGYFKLPMDVSKNISLDHIEAQSIFEKNWLLKQGMKKSRKFMKLTAKGWKESFLNKITPANASFNGHNTSCWKSEVLEVNGFNEDMKYGGQDRELGERLFNLGIKSKQIRYSAICVHLDHTRSYASASSIAFNDRIRRETRSRRLKWTNNGISKQKPESHS